MNFLKCFWRRDLLNSTPCALSTPLWTGKYHLNACGKPRVNDELSPAAKKPYSRAVKDDGRQQIRDTAVSRRCRPNRLAARQQQELPTGGQHLEHAFEVASFLSPNGSAACVSVTCLPSPAFAQGAEAIEFILHVFLPGADITSCTCYHPGAALFCRGTARLSGRRWLKSPSIAAVCPSSVQECRIRIASYNVLAKCYAKARHFTRCKPGACLRTYVAT